VTEAMPHVRSITVGVWLARGSRHESEPESGIAHFVEHMLFKGTTSRSARQIAQEIDSIGGQLDAFTAKEYAAYYIKVLDEHLPLALELLGDMMQRPAFAPEDIGREQAVILEEIKMVEDAPDDLVHEVFAQQCWPRHPLGRPILGSPETVSSFKQSIYGAFDLFRRTEPAHLGGGQSGHERMHDLISSSAPSADWRLANVRASRGIRRGVRQKDIEQSHVCLGMAAYHQATRIATRDVCTFWAAPWLAPVLLCEDRFQPTRSSAPLRTDAGVMTVTRVARRRKVSEVVDFPCDQLRASGAEVEPGERPPQGQPDVDRKARRGGCRTWRGV
jgi:hypothetical protein